MAEDAVVRRAEVAGEFSDHREIRIGAPLADLMGEDRDFHSFERLAEVVAEPACGVAQFALAEAHQACHLRAAEDLLRAVPVGAGGVEAAGIGLVPALRPLRSDLCVTARGFVRGREHHERRMVAISAQQERRFLLQIAGERAARIERHPQAALGLQVETELVRRDERRFRRTARMEADAVQPELLAAADDFFPRIHVRGRIAC